MSFFGSGLFPVNLVKRDNQLCRSVDLSSSLVYWLKLEMISWNCDITKEKNATPISIMKIPKIYSFVVTGPISPYPTVERVVKAKYEEIMSLS